MWDCNGVCTIEFNSEKFQLCHLQVAMLGKNLSHLTSGGGEDGEQIFSRRLTEIFAHVLTIYGKQLFLSEIFAHVMFEPKQYLENSFTKYIS